MDFGEDESSNSNAKSIFTFDVNLNSGFVSSFKKADGSLFFSSSALNNASILL